MSNITESQLEESSQELEEKVEIPLVSVIIPCFNHGKYLKEAVESIQGQTYENIEIIIVNDGSSDNTEEVAQSLVETDQKIKFVNLKENTGKWNALNRGIAQASGQYITFQDADDVSLPDRITRQVLVLASTNAMHVLCGFHHCHTEEELQKLKGTRVEEEELAGIPAEAVVTMVTYGLQTEGINHFYTAEFETAGVSSLFLRDVWVGGLRFNPPKMGLRVAASEDSDHNVRMCFLLRNTVVLAEKLYLYRRWTGTNNELK